MAQAGAPLKTAHATLSIHAGRMCMMEPSTVITSLMRYYRGTRNCTRRYGMRYHESSMHRGSRMKSLRPPRPRNIVHPAASLSAPRATASGIARRAAGRTNAEKPTHECGKPTPKTKDDFLRFKPSEPQANQALPALKIKTPSPS